jgi:hypothetical protein
MQFTNFISQIYFVNDIIYLTNIFCILDYQMTTLSPQTHFAT